MLSLFLTFHLTPSCCLVTQPTSSNQKKPSVHCEDVGRNSIFFSLNLLSLFPSLSLSNPDYERIETCAWKIEQCVNLFREVGIRRCQDQIITPAGRVRSRSNFSHLLHLNIVSLGAASGRSRNGTRSSWIESQGYDTERVAIFLKGVNATVNQGTELLSYCYRSVSLLWPRRDQGT